MVEGYKCKDILTESICNYGTKAYLLIKVKKSESKIAGLTPEISIKIVSTDSLYIIADLKNLNTRFKLPVEEEIRYVRNELDKYIESEMRADIRNGIELTREITGKLKLCRNIVLNQT